MRALWLHHPDDRAAVARGDQYLWGRDILVAPVAEKGATSRKVYLPGRPGSTSGPTRSRRRARNRPPVDLATMPLYVRAGAIIPLGPMKQYTDEPVTGSSHRDDLSGSRRRIPDVRRRWQIVRAPQGRLDRHRVHLARRLPPPHHPPRQRLPPARPGAPADGDPPRERSARLNAASGKSHSKAAN